MRNSLPAPVRDANFTPSPDDFIYAAANVATRYPVLPCDPSDRTPLTLHGFKDAAQDPAKVVEWWTQHPGALAGVPTGRVSEFVVIDDDTVKKPDAESTKWLDANRALLESMLHNKTRSGGTHYFFSLPDGVEFRSHQGITVAGVKLASIDTRGEGGYVIHWPSHGYASTGDTEAGDYAMNGPQFDALIARFEASPPAEHVTIILANPVSSLDQLRELLAAVETSDEAAALVQANPKLSRDLAGEREAEAAYRRMADWPAQCDAIAALPERERVAAITALSPGDRSLFIEGQLWAREHPDEHSAAYAYQRLIDPDGSIT